MLLGGVPDSEKVAELEGMAEDLGGWLGRNGDGDWTTMVRQGSRPPCVVVSHGRMVVSIWVGGQGYWMDRFWLAGVGRVEEPGEVGARLGRLVVGAERELAELQGVGVNLAVLREVRDRRRPGAGQPQGL